MILFLYLRINKNEKHMKTLKEQIENATTTEQLHSIIEAIPLQENGARQKIARTLDDAFWYVDLRTFEEIQNFMLKRL
jgi:5,10-methylene-tetrahydrofolate dehydrogenase/methenyl tetrahydrofolate cyclohydrolase